MPVIIKGLAPQEAPMLNGDLYKCMNSREKDSLPQSPEILLSLLSQKPHNIQSSMTSVTTHLYVMWQEGKELLCRWSVFIGGISNRYITICKIEGNSNGNLLYDSGSSNQASVTTQSGGKGLEVGGRFKRERTYVYFWLIHVDVWQKPTQYCKAITFQLKINKLKKSEVDSFCLRDSWYLMILGVYS